MPEMDGITMIKKLRNKCNKTPVITLTGGERMDQTATSINNMELGIHQALRKPVTKEEILTAISNVLTL